MNPKPAAKKMERLIMKRWPKMDTLPLRYYEVEINHLQYMWQRIYNGTVSGDKAVCGLGLGSLGLVYVQGVVRVSGGTTVGELVGVLAK